MLAPAPTSLRDWLAPGSAAIEQAIRRAGSPGYESWWQRCASVGFCANPIQASAFDPDQNRRVAVLIRCGNRRAAVCPSCSDLYAADTWQLIHAGAQGGHHGMPEDTAERPQVFATLTAPSFGAVHTSSSRPGQAGTVCHRPGNHKTQCRRRRDRPFRFRWAASYAGRVLVAGMLCGIASVLCAAFGLWSLRRLRTAGAELPTRSAAPTQLAAAVMLAAGGAVTLAAPGSGAVVLVGMCLAGAVGTIAAGSWQSARYALRREAARCAGDCAACPLSGNQISCG